MRITLNLASRPFADLGPAIKRLRIAIAALAVVAIGMGLGLHAFDQKAKQARERDHSLDGQIAGIAKERKGYQDMMRRPENAQLLAQVVALNRLFDEKEFSWTLAMEDLETVLPGGVQVSTLEPIRAKDGRITLHLRVIGPRDRAVELVRNLEHSRRFLLPRIVGENAESAGGPAERLEPISNSNRVDFDVLADYNPASLGERSAARKPPAIGVSSSDEAAPHTAHQISGPTLVAVPPTAHEPGRLPYSGQSKPKPSPSTGGPQ
jgi:type IV pilus assembly protein PilN